MTVGTGVAVFLYMSSQQRRLQELEKPKAKVLIAKVPIPSRATITEEMLETRELPEESVLPNYFRLKQKEEVVGQVALQNMVKGEYILKEKIASPGAALGLSFVIPQGKRAMTIRVDDVQGIAYLARPGDYVDVISTFQVPREDTTGQRAEPVDVSMIVMQDVQILALDQMSDMKTEGDKAPKYTLVTLSVDPLDAERLMLVLDKGPHHLVLRPHLDHEKLPTDGTTFEELVGEVNLPKAPSASRKEESRMRVEEVKPPPMPQPMMPRQLPPDLSQQAPVGLPQPQEILKPKQPQVEIIRGLSSEEVSGQGETGKEVKTNE